MEQFTTLCKFFYYGNLFFFSTFKNKQKINKNNSFLENLSSDIYYLEVGEKKNQPAFYQYLIGGWGGISSVQLYLVGIVKENDV